MATYGAAVMLGVGGSTLLVTALTMLADLIGENVVSWLLFFGLNTMSVFSFKE